MVVRTESFKAVHKSAVAIYEHADVTSRKLGTSAPNKPIVGLGWDVSGEWQRVKLEEFPGDDTEGWVRVHSEYGPLLRPLDRTADVDAKVPQLSQPPALSLGVQGLGLDNVNAMLDLKRQLEEQLAKMGVETQTPTYNQASLPERPARQRAPRPGRFSAFARDRLGIADDDSDFALVPSAAAIAAGRSTAQCRGQLYEVVFDKVPVRKFPSIHAAPLRLAPRGSRMRLYEWDHTRRWRRCNVMRAVDPEEDLAQGDQAVRGIVQSDGWVMVAHPSYGVLLQATYDEGAVCEGDIDLSRRVVGAQMGGAKSSNNTAGMEAFGKVVASGDASALKEPMLMQAVRAGNYEVVRNVLAGVFGYQHPNMTDALGETALFEASSIGRVDLVALLLLYGADACTTSMDGRTPAQVAACPIVKALLARWRGEPADSPLLLQAVARANLQDRQRLAMALCVDGPELAELKLELRAKDGMADMIERAPAPEASPGGHTPRGGASSDAAESPAAAELVLYRVVYSKPVAVREYPNAASRIVRAKMPGDEVEMYDWDGTRCWRRVRVMAEVNDEDGDLREVDGWMLVASDSLGPLLEEIPRGAAAQKADAEGEDLDIASEKHFFARKEFGG